MCKVRRTIEAHQNRLKVAQPTAQKVEEKGAEKEEPGTVCPIPIPHPDRAPRKSKKKKHKRKHKRKKRKHNHKKKPHQQNQVLPVDADSASDGQVTAPPERNSGQRLPPIKTQKKISKKNTAAVVEDIHKNFHREQYDGQQAMKSQSKKARSRLKTRLLNRGIDKSFRAKGNEQHSHESTRALHLFGKEYEKPEAPGGGDDLSATHFLTQEQMRRVHAQFQATENGDNKSTDNEPENKNIALMVRHRLAVVGGLKDDKDESEEEENTFVKSTSTLLAFFLDLIRENIHEIKTRSKHFLKDPRKRLVSMDRY